MFKRVIAIGDIHGQIDLLKDLIENIISFTKEDQLIFMGDYFDRAPNEKEIETLLYLQNLKDKSPNNIITLCGNHEDMALNCINNNSPYFFESWWYNGGNARQWLDRVDLLTALKTFILECALFYETETHIFVHAGATEWALRNPKDMSARSILLWDRTGNQHRCFNKRLVVGHTIQHSVLIDDHRICVDTGAHRSGLLSAYDVKNSVTYCSYRKWKI